jgi:cyanophycin synthetase
MGILSISIARRLQGFRRSPRKLQKLRDSISDLKWWALTARSRWALRGFKGPIIAITGTKGKTTTTRLISRILKDAGYRVGTACSGGIYVNGDCVIPQSYAGADGPILAYRAGGADVLVLETAHGGILRYGCGFPRCDVAVFTNITDGHLGELGIESLQEMLALKWRLASKLRPGGTIILNADDSLLASAVPPPTVKVAYMTISQGRVPGVAGLSSSLYRYEGGKIVKETEEGSGAVADISDAPLLFGGLLLYNAYNLLAAIAATEAVRPLLPVSQESLLSSLLSFGACPDDNPGRFNLFEVPGGRVVLLAGSNRDSYRRDAEALAHIRDRRPFPVRRIVGVMTGIGTHSNDYMRDLARIASSVCDEIVIREPRLRYQRGRLPGEISSILKAGAMEAGLPESSIKVCGDSFDLIRDLVLISGAQERLVALFCSFAQEPVLDLCHRLAGLADRTH